MGTVAQLIDGRERAETVRSFAVSNWRRLMGVDNIISHILFFLSSSWFHCLRRPTISNQYLVVFILSTVTPIVNGISFTLFGDEKLNVLDESPLESPVSEAVLR